MRRRTARAGIYQDASPKDHAPMPEPNGRHLWVCIGVWRVANPAATRQILDLENMLTVKGPGCYWCEQPWTPTMGAHCPGEPVA